MHKFTRAYLFQIFKDHKVHKFTRAYLFQIALEIMHVITYTYTR